MSDSFLDTRRNVLMSKYGFQFHKRLGQNFLMDEQVLADIATIAGLSRADMVVEIGAGSGMLTAELAAQAGFVAAVELDETLCAILRELFNETPNVEIIHGDAMKLDFAAIQDDGKREGFDQPFKIVANLPYYITTPLLFRFLEQRYYWTEMTLMVQKEVAERICAAPGGKDYGALTLAVAYDTEATLARAVPADCFRPRPNVDSAVLHLKRRLHPPAPVSDRAKFQQLVKASFAQRRKTIQNALTNGNLGLDRDEVILLLHRAAIDPQRRGETLPFAEFAALANHWYDYEKTIK